MLSTPKFWQNQNGLNSIISALLTPFSWLYLLGFFIKKKLIKTRSVNLPVICIGNLNAGGAGKTPCALAIGKILQEKGIEFCYLTRGYGAENDQVKFFEKNRLVFGQNRQKAQEVGDEAILLNEIAPICVAKNRFLGAKEIVSQARFKAILLDDGLQNFSLKKDLSILVIDSQIGFGNSKILPAGPLRQTIKSGLQNVDLVVIIGQKNEELFNKIRATKPELMHQILENSDVNRINYAKISSQNYQKFLGQKIFAFCGLAYPSKFFSFLDNQGFEVIKTKSFPDHHFYQEFELFELQNYAKKLGGILLTTKKDWVKFSSKMQQEIDYLDVALELENKELITEMIKQKIANFNQ